MYVNVAVLKETEPHERRVALVPSVVPRLMKLGGRLHMQAGAGVAIRLADEAYHDVAIISDRLAMVRDADVVLAVQPPALDVIDAMQPGAILVCFVYAANEPQLVKRLLARRITCFAMERIPRISRAQSMDALSSQSALAGYYAVALGMTHMAGVLPKITSAAGVIGPAKVLVMGLGVAGLEAIATAQRLGAVVEGYDVRPVTREQALSLGATFVDTGVDATGKGGYARALTAQEQTTVDAALTQHIQAADLIITTAAIPGKASPKLISHAQVAAMKSGAVIVDLSAEGGGNCVDTVPGKTIEVRAVTLVAPLNVPSLLGREAGLLLTVIMAKAMNRSIANVLFTNFGTLAKAEPGAIKGSERPTDAADAAIKMRYASKVIIIPGYGLAAAHAQQKLFEFVKLLLAAKVSVQFAIHPVAGRMPGQMDVLLAEAGVPYDMIYQLDDINDDFATTDVALVIGANDVVNPAARSDKSSPIFGMPILNADKAAQAYVIKRGQGKGYSGIVNALFYAPNCNMVYGDAQAVLIKMIEAVRGLGAAAA